MPPCPQKREIGPRNLTQTVTSTPRSSGRGSKKDARIAGVFIEVVDLKTLAAFAGGIAGRNGPRSSSGNDGQRFDLLRARAAPVN